MTIFLHCYRREFSRARPMRLTVTNGIDDDLFGEQIMIESLPDNSTETPKKLSSCKSKRKHRFLILCIIFFKYRLKLSLILEIIAIRNRIVKN